MPAGVRHISDMLRRLQDFQPPLGQPQSLMPSRHQVSNPRYAPPGLGKLSPIRSEYAVTLCPAGIHISLRRFTSRPEESETQCRSAHKPSEQVMRVFISHVREDAAVAEALARVIAERGHQVVARDSGDAALADSDAMVVVVSPRSVESPFVRRESSLRLPRPVSQSA